MTRIVGIGNPMRGDDAAGRAVARRLKARAPHLDVVESDGEATRLLTLIEHRPSVILIDAAVTGAAPGTLHRLDAARPLPAQLAEASTHGLGLAQALELARALGALPGRTTVHAIEAAAFTPGAPLSPEVARAVDALVERLLAELRQTSARPAAAGAVPSAARH